jgi:hypothetical protein
VRFFATSEEWLLLLPQFVFVICRGWEEHCHVQGCLSSLVPFGSCAMCDLLWALDAQQHALPSTCHGSTPLLSVRPSVHPSSYSVHLFHSQSERMTRYYTKSLKQAVEAGRELAQRRNNNSDDDGGSGGNGGGGSSSSSYDADADAVFYDVPNFAAAVQRAIGQQALEVLVERLESGAEGGWQNYDDAVRLEWVEGEKRQ